MTPDEVVRQFLDREGMAGAGRVLASLDQWTVDSARRRDELCFDQSYVALDRDTNTADVDEDIEPTTRCTIGIPKFERHLRSCLETFDD